MTRICHAALLLFAVLSLGSPVVAENGIIPDEARYIKKPGQPYVRPGLRRIKIPKTKQQILADIKAGKVPSREEILDPISDGKPRKIRPHVSERLHPKREKTKEQLAKEEKARKLEQYYHRKAVLDSL